LRLFFAISALKGFLPQSREGMAAVSAKKTHFQERAVKVKIL